MECVCACLCVTKWCVRVSCVCVCASALADVCVSTCLPVSARQVGSNLSVFPVYVCVFLWEEGDRNISGDDSPVFCDSGAERVLFTHFSPLRLACKTRNGERIKKKRRGRVSVREH